MSGRWMTLEETAELLGVKKSLIYRLSSQGQLPGKVVLGHRTVRVDREVLETSLRARAEGGGDGAHIPPHA